MQLLPVVCCLLHFCKILVGLSCAATTSSSVVLKQVMIVIAAVHIVCKVSGVLAAT